MSSFFTRIKTKIRRSNIFFPGSARYWENRYARGGNSGSGSFYRLALFKAHVINDFVKKKNITSVLELGCGDGRQLLSADYPRYSGFDISVSAINKCLQLYKNDSAKHFYLYDPDTFSGNVSQYRSELALSLDVLYHLIEDKAYHRYLIDLFAAAEKYVIIYSSNMNLKWRYHEKHRQFLPWVIDQFPDWQLEEYIENKYKFDPKDPDNTSRSDFYIFGKK